MYLIVCTYKHILCIIYIIYLLLKDFSQNCLEKTYFGTIIEKLWKFISKTEDILL